jgi:hypothetical protein
MLPPKISSRIEKTDKCWNWVGSINIKGYGRMWLNELGRTDYAHRIVYRLLVGAIPKDLTIDHLCGNKRCVNPKHLEAVTIGVNILRSNGPAAINSRKTKCKKGHPLAGNNLLLHNRPGGHVKRMCRICWNRYWVEWRKKRATL